MQQFIQLVTTTLGTSEQAARLATGSLLNLLNARAPKNDMTALLAKLPGAADLLKMFQGAPAEPAAPTGLGALTDAAASLLGGSSSMLGAGAKALGASAGNLATLTSALSQSGLDIAKVPQFVALFGQWATQQAGSDLVQRVLSSVPALGSVLESLGRKP